MKQEQDEFDAIVLQSNDTIHAESEPTFRDLLKERILTFATSRNFTTETIDTLSEDEDPYEYPENDVWTEFEFEGVYDDPLGYYEINVTDGTWWNDLDGLTVSQLHVRGTQSIGSVRRGGNPLWALCLFFEFDTFFDASQWQAFSFWVHLSTYSEDYLMFGLYDENINLATIMYNCTSGSGVFEWKWADFSDPNWWVDEGFDWSRILGFVFATDAFEGDELTWYYMRIDYPLFWRDPDFVPYGLIDIAELESPSMRLCGQLIRHGPESIEEYDFYSVHMTIKNKWTDDPTEIVCMPYLKILMVVSGVADEFPESHQPRSGEYDHQSVVSFALPGLPVSFPITLPMLTIEYNSWYEDGFFKVEWVGKYGLYPAYCIGSSVIEDYGDFVIGLRVPADFKPYVAIMAEAVWYEYHQINVHTGLFIYKTDERLYWLVVDPPGVEEFTPELPPLPEYPEEIPKYTPPDIGGGCYSISVIR